MLPKAIKLLLLAAAVTLSLSPAFAQDRHGGYGGGHNGGHGGGEIHQGSYGGNYNGGHDGYRGSGNYQDGHGPYYIQPRRNNRHRAQVYYNTYDPYYDGYNSYPRSYSGGFVGIRTGGGNGHRRSHHEHH